MEQISSMELFRKHPSLCSLFLLALEDWGASRVDWSLLNDEEFADLLQWMRKEGARLGGNTGAMVMRTMGKDGFMLSRDVVARLVEEGVIEGPPKSKHALTMVQTAFNMWQGESGLSLMAISRVLARSIG